MRVALTGSPMPHDRTSSRESQGTYGRQRASGSAPPSPNALADRLRSDTARFSFSRRSRVGPAGWRVPVAKSNGAGEEGGSRSLIWQAFGSARQRAMVGLIQAGHASSLCQTNVQKKHMNFTVFRSQNPAHTGEQGVCGLQHRSARSCRQPTHTHMHTNMHRTPENAESLFARRSSPDRVLLRSRPYVTSVSSCESLSACLLSARWRRRLLDASILQVWRWRML